MTQGTPIQLNRTFLDVPDRAKGADPETMMRIALALSQSATWDELLKHHHIVILGEAGTGKTTEFKIQTERLLKSNATAFFVAIEELASEGLEGYFDHENSKRFKEWRSQSNDAFFFLDSLDEAKLSRQFLGKALRKLNRVLGADILRARLVVSCRVSDWSVDADREEIEAIIPKKYQDGKDRDSEDIKVHVVCLAPLVEEQIIQLAKYFGVEDADAFIKDIRNARAQVFVERPLDVKWMAEYWLDNRKLGSLSQLIGSNIRQKLHDKPGRGSTLTFEKARQGITLLAGISTLSAKWNYILPDIGTIRDREASAIDPRNVLPDWSDDEIRQMLTLPIFDEATYGCVRIHHSSVREFLSAQWLRNLSEIGLPKSILQELIFRKSSGKNVIPPHLESTVAWLCLWDEDIRAEVIRSSPELLIAGGDPSGLSTEDRCKLLRSYASKYHERERMFHSFDHASLGRFSCIALADTINELLSKETEAEELLSTLLNIVTEGRLNTCSSMA